MWTNTPKDHPDHAKDSLHGKVMMFLTVIAASAAIYTSKEQTEIRTDTASTVASVVPKIPQESKTSEIKPFEIQSGIELKAIEPQINLDFSGDPLHILPGKKITKRKIKNFPTPFINPTSTTIDDHKFQLDHKDPGQE